jgi:hypothetical protein
VECELAGETEVLGENLPQRHFVHQSGHVAWPDAGSNPGRRGGKLETNAWAMARPRDSGLHKKS